MSESEPKKETVRITLPPRPTVGEAGAAPVKKETVRINLPSRPTLGTTPTADPKKESTKLTNLAKPPVLNPPRPAAPGLNPPLARSAPAVPVKTDHRAGCGCRSCGPRCTGGPGRTVCPQAARCPDGRGTCRTVRAQAADGPWCPQTACCPGHSGGTCRPCSRRTVCTGGSDGSWRAQAADPGGWPHAAPGTRRAQVSGDADVDHHAVDAHADSGSGRVKPTPKKDTVRIEVPNAKQVPQATVKLQQTQPLIRPPAAEVRTVAAPAVIDLPGDTDEVAEEDSLLKMASVGVFVLSLITVAIQLWGLFTNK